MSNQNFHTPRNVIEPFQYDRVQNYIESYKSSNEINDLIEIYLILKLLKKESEFSNFKYLIKQFNTDLSKNFPVSMFEIDYTSIDISYRNVFWELVLFLGKINQNDVRDFELYIKKYDIRTMTLKNVTELIDLFPQVIKENFLSLPRNVEFFLNNQSGKYTDSQNGLYTKLEITNEEINDLARKYCEIDSINPNYLQLIVEYKKLSKYEFNDQTKLLAKRTYDKFWERHFQTNEGIQYSQSVAISPLQSDVLCTQVNNEIIINKTILDEYHDFPTLLNNYIYILDYFNYETGLPWLVANDETFSFTRLFSPKSNAHFEDYDHHLKLSYDLLFSAYFYYLKKNDIDIEKIIEWYFNTYLKTELNIKGFQFHPSNKESSYYERGKSIVSEMDSILDQYELFFRNGEIDQGLLEIKSKASSYASLKSFNEKKFLKLSHTSDNSSLFSTLFSDQSTLSTISSKKEPSTFFEHIKSGVKITDFEDYQVELIKILIDKDFLKLSNELITFTNFQEINILNKLWRSGTYCLYYKDKLILDIAEDLCRKGYCEYSDKLFSDHETNYLSYILDDKQYGNGLKIRNKFVHGKFAYKSEEEHLQNYLELLQIVIFYVIRINDELEYYTQVRQSKR